MQNSINQSNYLHLVEHVMQITIYNKADEIIQKLLGSFFSR